MIVRKNLGIIFGNIGLGAKQQENEILFTQGDIFIQRKIHHKFS